MDLLTLVPVMAEQSGLAEFTHFLVHGISKPDCHAKIVASGSDSSGILHWRINWYGAGGLVVDPHLRYASAELALQAVRDSFTAYEPCDKPMPGDSRATVKGN